MNALKSKEIYLILRLPLALKKLESLEERLEHLYHPLFDLADRATARSIEQFVKRNQRIALTLLERVKETAPKDYAIFLVRPLQKMLWDSGNLSYNQLTYLSCYLHDWLPDRLDSYSLKIEDAYLYWQRFIFQINLNDPELIEFLLGKELEILGKLDLPLEKLEYVSDRLSDLSSIYTPTTIPTFYQIDSLKIYMETLLNQEYKRLSKILVKRADLWPPQTNVEKIDLTITVSQLSSLTRILADSGIFYEPNRRELLRQIARHFTTEKVKNISANSLVNHFYDPDSKTQSWLKSLLETAIDKLERDDFVADKTR